MITIMSRLVVWGLGGHAVKNILPALFKMTNISLYGVCSRDTKIVEQCSNRFKCNHWTDAAAMLADPNVDVVYLATPIGLHALQGQQILEAGKHLWCEKSFTANINDTKNLLSLAEKNNLVVAESFMYLDHPHFFRIQRVVQEQEMGQIKSVYCRFGIPFLNKPGFRNDLKLSGGAFWDVGSYTISAVLALFPTKTWQVIYSERLFKDPVDIDCEGRSIVRFDGGITAYLEWHIGVAYKNELNILAEKGSLQTDKIFSKSSDYMPAIIFSDQNGVKSEELVAQSNHFVNMLHRFVGLLESNKKAVKERQAILNRATLLNEIAEF
jgi:predicted dehydrogenase